MGYVRIYHGWFKDLIDLLQDGRSNLWLGPGRASQRRLCGLGRRFNECAAKARRSLPEEEESAACHTHFASQS